MTPRRRPLWLAMQRSPSRVRGSPRETSQCPFLCTRDTSFLDSVEKSEKMRRTKRRRKIRERNRSRRQARGNKLPCVMLAGSPPTSPSLSLSTCLPPPFLSSSFLPLSLSLSLSLSLLYLYLMNGSDRRHILCGGAELLLVSPHQRVRPAINQNNTINLKWIKLVYLYYILYYIIFLLIYLFIYLFYFSCKRDNKLRRRREGKEGEDKYLQCINQSIV